MNTTTLKNTSTKKHSMNVFKMEAATVKMLRNEKGMTMKELALAVGVSKNSKLVSRIEQGKSSIPNNLLYKFSVALDIPLKVLYDLKVEIFEANLQEEIHGEIQKA